MYSIYAFNPAYNRQYNVGHITKPSYMSEWLKKNAHVHFTYELRKEEHVHSKWHWNFDTERWGRMATPSKEDSEKDSDEEFEKKNTKYFRKLIRKEILKSKQNKEKKRFL